MNEPFSVKDWMRLALRIEADGSTDLDDVLDALSHAVDADLAWIVRDGEIVARVGVSTDASIDQLLVDTALAEGNRLELESGDSCEIARRELPTVSALLVAGRRDEFTVEDHEAISAIAHLLDLGLGGRHPAPATDDLGPESAPSPLHQVLGASDALTGLVSPRCAASRDGRR